MMRHYSVEDHESDIEPSPDKPWRMTMLEFHNSKHCEGTKPGRYGNHEHTSAVKAVEDECPRMRNPVGELDEARKSEKRDAVWPFLIALIVISLIAFAAFLAKIYFGFHF